MKDIVRFCVSLPRDLLEKFDEKIDRKMYRNRSEAIRDLIRDSLIEEKWEAPDEEVVGALTLVYDREKREISDRLTDIQYSALSNVISTTHVHLDEKNCLEMIAIGGKAGDVEKISDELISSEGVKHGELVRTAVI